MKKISQICNVILFLLLCASLTYWVLYFISPAPKTAQTLHAYEYKQPAISEAASLLGGRTGSQLAISLKGVILSGTSEESMAIFGVAGNARRYAARHAELAPGITLEEIHAKHVVVLDHGLRREVPLATFTPASSKPVASNYMGNSVVRGVGTDLQREGAEVMVPATQSGSSTAGQEGAGSVKNSESDRESNGR